MATTGTTAGTASTPDRPRLTVPATVISLLPLEPALRAAAVAAAVQLGTQLEIDLHRLEELAPGAGRRAGRYWAATRQLWARLQAGEAADAVKVLHPLRSAEQSTAKGARRDLHDELQALQLVPACAPLLHLLDPTPDVDALAAHGEVAVNDATTTMSITAEAGVFPLALGGPPRPGEQHRHIEVTASHARWRDRRARRMTCVNVTAVELWPDPSEF